jgi:hypothetical protein
LTRCIDHRSLHTSGRTSAGAPAGQGRAKRARVAGRLDGTHQRAGYNPAREATVHFARIKESITLSMVLSRFGVLADMKKVGAQLHGCCPIHQGSNPKQFVVNLQRNTWHCFGDCNRGGGVIDLVALREGVTIKQAAHLLVEWFAISSPPKRQPLHERSNTMNSRPSHRAYIVEGREGQDNEQGGFWTRVGSAWPHKDGKGLNIQLVPGLAVSGRLVLREHTAEDEEADKKRAAKRK